MQGRDQSGAIALAMLIVGGIGAIVYFLLRKKKPTEGGPVTPAVIASSVAQKVDAGYTKDLENASDTIIKKYAGWIDRIEEIAVQMKKGLLKKATVELIGNCHTLIDLSDATLIGVVRYWESRRGRNISSHAGFNGVLDDSESLPQLLARFRELNLIQ